MTRTRNPSSSSSGTDKRLPFLKDQGSYQKGDNAIDKREPRGSYRLQNITTSVTFYGLLRPRIVSKMKSLDAICYKDNCP